MLEDIEISAIQDKNARQLMRRLLNLIEKLSADLRDKQAENQALRDEINHLKGEQDKPNTKANKEKSAEAGNHSPVCVLLPVRVRTRTGTRTGRSWPRPPENWMLVFTPIYMTGLAKLMPFHLWQI